MTTHGQSLESLLKPLLEYVVGLARLNTPFRETLAQRLTTLGNGTPFQTSAQTGGMTLIEALSTYKAKIDADVRSGELSMANCNRQKASLAVMLRYVPDQPLSELSYGPLAETVASIKDRKTTSYSPDTVQTTIRDMRLFFCWLEDSGYWAPAFNAQRLLRVRKHKLMTIDESQRAALGQPVFTPKELRILYQAATDEQRLYMLLGLNLAATQQQIADLLKSDVRLDASPPYIEFVRGKTRHCGTGILAHYELWPESEKLLRQRLSKTQQTREGWALLTKDGHRMVRWHDNGSRCDPILISWKFLLERVELSEERKLSFKYLRKTVADFVLRLSDEPTQQLMLAHARRTMAARHYTGKPDFSRLNEALRRIREETLAEMFVAVSK